MTAIRRVFSGLHRQAAFLMLCVVLGALLVPLPRVRADRPELPAGLCGLVSAQVVCYDPDRATPHFLSPADQRVVDFSISPGGEWLAYRLTNGSAIITAIYGDPMALVIDNGAIPPSELDTAATTLSWSPDGMAIAYLTANGLRVAFPPQPDLPAYASSTIRAFTNLRFSPHGTRLAAQADDGSWIIFAINTSDHTIRRTRTIEQSGEVAWFNDTTLAVALLSGGLMGVNADDAAQAPAWTMPDDHFIKLLSTSSGQVVAVHPDPGDTVGSAVAIAADGTITALGDSKVDSRVRWGPDGQVMVYIVTGTPILVDRATGAEDMLPVRDVSRVVWSPPLPQRVTTVKIDSDLYFLAPDAKGVRQLWLLARGGGELRQVTHEVTAVSAYAISPDKTQVAYFSGSRLIVTTFANMSRQRLLAVLPASLSKPGLTPDTKLHWRADGLQIAYSVAGIGGGLFVAATTINVGLDRPTLHKSLLIKGTGSAAQLRQNNASSGYTDPRFSPDGRYLLVSTYGGSGGSVYRLIDVQKPVEDIPAPVDSSYSLMWAVNNLLLACSTPVTPSGSASLFLTPVIGGQTLLLVSPSQHIGDARVTNDSSVLFLRSMGWFSSDNHDMGPQVVAMQRLTIQPDGKVTSTSIGSAAIIQRGLIAPSGKFAAGLQRSGTMDKLVILDVQSGQVVQLQDADDVTSLLWID